MPRTTTVAQLMINRALPEEFRDEERELTSKNLNAVLTEIARKYPDRYREIAFRLTQLGQLFSYRLGGLSFGLEDLRKSPRSQKIQEELRAEIRNILANRSLSSEEKNRLIVEATGRAMSRQTKAVFEEGLEQDNPLALQAYSGVRGNVMNFNSLVGGDLLFTDHKDRVIPVPVLHSYAEGLSPVEYIAGSFGARRGVIDLKVGTADAGYYAKLLTQAAHRLVVTDYDRQEDSEFPLGLPVSVDDPDNLGAVLAADAGGVPAHTVLTREVLQELKKRGVKRILVRSPILPGPPDGGLYAVDVGVRESGNFPARGEFVGLRAAQTIGERVSQQTISSKHCLAEGTLVRMADGSTRPIEQVVEGDWVLGSDLQGQTRSTCVVKVYRNGLRMCYRTRFVAEPEADDGSQAILLESTGEHRLLARLETTEPGGDRPGKFPVGAWHGPDDAIYWALVRAETGQIMPYRRELQECVGLRPTYDLQVEHPEHLFVLANGLIVSNSGGVAGANKTTSGFKLLENLVYVPKSFSGVATHAQTDGIVEKIEPNPAGGTLVWIAGQKHFVAPTQQVSVRVGDQVLAGDLLSDGWPHPKELVKHLGIGEGRRRFVEVFTEALKSAGVQPHRRNLELIAKGLINHVVLQDEIGDYVPGDVIPYSLIEKDWQPRPEAQRLSPRQAKNMYLEKPVLHYTIGTRITPRVIETLEEFGVPQILAHAEPPPFVPEMVRAMDNLQRDPDWMTRLFGSGIRKGFIQAAQRGASSDRLGTSFVPSLAHGLQFGLEGKIRPAKIRPAEGQIFRDPGEAALPDWKIWLSEMEQALRTGPPEAADGPPGPRSRASAAEAPMQTEMVVPAAAGMSSERRLDRPRF